MLRIIFALMLLTSCAKQNINDVPKGASLFIEMPTNLTVFENISPIVYDALWEQFLRVGFSLRSQGDYTLKTKIVKLENVERFVSPDVLPYVFKVNLTLECSLFDIHGKLIKVKKFNFFKWVSRPSDPALSWTYLKAQYKNLLDKNVRRIEHYFRKFILDNYAI